jgi:hypothetical protein
MACNEELRTFLIDNRYLSPENRLLVSFTTNFYNLVQ